MEGKCIVSGCGKAASKCCGSCGRVRYCSVECQKEDWKKCHKTSECVNMKKLSTVSLTEIEIADAVSRITRLSCRLLDAGEPERCTFVLKECIVFARDRLGRLDCKDSCSMIGGGVKLNHITICLLLVQLGVIYYNMPRSPETDNDTISYLSEALELLMQRKDVGKDGIRVLELRFACHEPLCNLYAKLGQLEISKYHAEQYAATARQYEGPDKVDYTMAALTFLSNSLRLESKYPEALAAAEESYLIASKKHSPAHKMVLVASRQMINCLIAMKDYSTADTYCRMNYSNLFDPLNTEEYDVDDKADSISQMVQIWLAKEPDDDEIVEKALADEAIDLSRRILTLDKKSWHTEIDFEGLSRLSHVLLKATRLTEETEGLLHQLVKYCITNNCFDNVHTRYSVVNLTDFYLKLHESLPTGKHSTLVLDNIELCDKLILKFDSCDDISSDYTKLSQIIKPYFKNNAELCI